MIGFVDDTRFYNNQHTLSDNIVVDVKHDLSMWQSLMDISAGKLNTKKNVHVTSYNRHTTEKIFWKCVIENMKIKL